MLLLRLDAGKFHRRGGHGFDGRRPVDRKGLLDEHLVTVPLLMQQHAWHAHRCPLVLADAVQGRSLGCDQVVGEGVDADLGERGGAPASIEKLDDRLLHGTHRADVEGGGHLTQHLAKPVDQRQHRRRVGYRASCSAPDDDPVGVSRQQAQAGRSDGRDRTHPRSRAGGHAPVAQGSSGDRTGAVRHQDARMGGVRQWHELQVRTVTSRLTAADHLDPVRVWPQESELVDHVGPRSTNGARLDVGCSGHGTV